MLLNIMEEWGGKYSTKGEAWETLKGICASCDIQLQGILAETEKDVMPELETKADIVDEEKTETSPLLANEEHDENSGKEVLAESESDQVNSKEAAKTGIINENDTEETLLDAEIGKEVVVTSDETREIQGKGQPEISNDNKSHIKGTQAEQDNMVVLHKNTQGNVVYTNESSVNKVRQTEDSTDQTFPGEASQAITERAKNDQNVHGVSEETKPSMISQERKDPSESSPGAKSGSK